MSLPWGTTFFVQKADDIPNPILTIAGDAVHNLRSALDHLAWQLVEASNNTPDCHTGFPIYNPKAKGFKTKDDIAKFCERKVAGMRPEMIAAIELQKLTREGAILCGQSTSFDITDKHHLLLAAGFVSHQFTFKGRYAIPLTKRFVVKEGEDIVTILRDLEPEEQPKFSFEIVVGQSGRFYGKSLIESLSTMFDVVDNLISDFLPFLI